METLETLLSRKAELDGVMSRIDVWLVVFGIFVVIGVAGESMFGIRAWWNNRKLHSVQESIDHFRQTEIAQLTVSSDSLKRDIKESDARIAEAQRGSAEANERAAQAQQSLALAEQHAAEANTKAEGFRLDIAKANERAASANETAERERLARLQLEARLAPRMLTAAQQSEITRALAGFKGRGLDVLIYGGDTPEIIRFASLTLAAISGAGWEVRVWSVLSGGMSVSGVLVATRRGSDSNTEATANALVTALRSQGVDINRWDNQFGDELPAALTGPNWDTKNIAPIRMLIGAKP